jgi:hypothetical protein
MASTAVRRTVKHQRKTNIRLFLLQGWRHGADLSGSITVNGTALWSAILAAQSFQYDAEAYLDGARPRRQLGEVRRHRRTSSGTPDGMWPHNLLCSTLFRCTSHAPPHWATAMFRLWEKATARCADPELANKRHNLEQGPVARRQRWGRALHSLCCGRARWRNFRCRCTRWQGLRR